MARKIDSPGQTQTPFAGPAPLVITEWDEGTACPQGWLGVEITYRREPSSGVARAEWSPLRAVLDDPDDFFRR